MRTRSSCGLATQSPVQTPKVVLLAVTGHELDAERSSAAPDDLALSRMARHERKFVRPPIASVGRPAARNRVLTSFTMVSAEDTAARERSRFKIVCEDCASLSIKVADPANSPNATLVRCGRCNAVRGTLEELHDLARRGNDVFEF